MNNPHFASKEFPEEAHLLMPDDKGEIVPLKKQTKLVEIATYWDRQGAKVGLLLGGTTLILMVVLINESNLVAPLWSSMVTFVTTYLFGLVGMK